MNKNIVVTAVVSAVTGSVLGGVLTYATVNRALRTRYEDWANSEIDDVKRRYALLRKDDGDLSILEMAKNPSPEVQAAVDKGKRIIEQMGYSPEENAPTKGEGLSIFDREDVIDLNPSQDEEEDEDESDDEDIHDGYKVIEGQPYKITEAAYFENEPEYTLDTLTYYEIDDTLCDESNSQIERVEETIGERHLHMFHKDVQGKGKTSLYIRNDDHQTLYEVILVNSSFAAVVLGMDEETLGLRAPKERPRRMRDGD